jgi:hypothetical protein
LSFQKRTRTNIKTEWDEKFKALHIEISRKRDELKHNKLKMTCAGHILDAFAILKLKLENKYKFMLGFIDQLTNRYNSESVKQMTPNNEAPFVSLIRNDKLDEFMQTKADEITDGIYLCNIFNTETNFADEKKYSEMIAVYDEAIKKIFSDKLFTIADSFNIFKHLIGYVDYPYMEKAQLKIILPDLERKSEVFVRHLKAPNPDKRVFINLPGDEMEERWKEQSKPHLAFPTPVSIQSKHKLILTQMEELAFEDTYLKQ